MTVAASFGLASALSRGRAGRRVAATPPAQPEDEDRRHRGDVGHRARAGFLHGLRHSRSQDAHHPCYEVKVPWVLGLIATRSSDTPVPGINDLVELAASRITNGMIAYRRAGEAEGPTATTRRCASSSTPMSTISAMRCCSSAIRPDIENATDAQIERRGNPPFRTCRCCSGRSASWWAWASGSLRCSRWPSGFRPSASSTSYRAVPEGCVVEPAAAVDCGRTGLDRRRIWPPALGDRRRSADRARRLLDRRRQCAVQPAGLRAVLLSAARRRSLSDGQIHPAGSGRHARPSRALPLARIRGGVDHDAITKCCASSGGRCSAFC